MYTFRVRAKPAQILSIGRFGVIVRANGNVTTAQDNGNVLNMRRMQVARHEACFCKHRRVCYKYVHYLSRCELFECWKNLIKLVESSVDKSAVLVEPLDIYSSQSSRRAALPTHNRWVEHYLDEAFG